MPYYRPTKATLADGRKIDNRKKLTVTLSADSIATLQHMIVYCIENGICMGMDEGISPKTNRKFKYRIELEDFAYRGVGVNNHD